MADNSTHCGVQWNSGVLPSDPGNISSFTANADSWGIVLRWSLPGLNPHAIAFIKLFRSTSSNTGSKSYLATVSGSAYRDPMDNNQTGTRYYYWLEVTSINGTVQAQLGPVSDVTNSQSAHVMDLINQQISESALSAALQTKIQEISSLRSDLIDETTGRLLALANVDSTLLGLGVDITQVNAAIVSEQTARINGQNALVTDINAVVASNAQNLAAIIQEQSARVAADAAEATARTTLATQVGNDISSAISTLDTSITGPNGALATQKTDIVANFIIKTFRQDTTPAMTTGQNIGSLWYDTDDGNKLYRWDGSTWEISADQVAIDAFAAIQQLNTTLSDGTHAVAQKATQVEAVVDFINSPLNPDGLVAAHGRADDLNLDIANLYNTNLPTSISAVAEDTITAQVGYCVIGRTESNNVVTNYGIPSTDPDHITKEGCEGAGHHWLARNEISEAVLGVQIDDGESSAKIQQQMTAYRDELGVLNANYTVKIDTNGVIGGFGLGYNGETDTIDAVFDVTRFAIGDANSQGVRPFVIAPQDPTDPDSDQKVFMDNVYIRQASIGTLHLANDAISSDSMSVVSGVCSAVNYQTSDETKLLRYSYTPVTDSNANVLQVTPASSPAVFFGTTGLPELIFDIELVDGKTHVPVEMVIEFQAGLATIGGNNNYAVAFTPGFEAELWFNNTKLYSYVIALSTEIIRLGNVYPNKIWPYTITKTIYVQTGVEFRLKLLSAGMMFNADSNFGTPTTDSAVIKWAFIQDISMRARYIKR